MENINQMPNLQPIEPISPVKNQNIFKYLFIISIIVLLGVIISFYFVLNNKINQLSNKQSTEITSATTQITETNSEIIPAKDSVNINQIFDQIYQQIKKADGVKTIELQDNSLTWWITQDNRSIFVPSELTFTAKIQGKEISNIKKELNKIVANILLQKFTLDKNNSSLSETDNSFYDYIQAYNFDNLKCIATSSGDESIVGENNESNFDFSCITDEQINIAYSEQLPFLKVLNYGIDMAIANITIKNNMAEMSVRGRRTGGLAFMYKNNNQWILIAEGNGFPSCNELEEKKIPIKYWVSCTDSSNNIIKGNFNVD